MFSYRDLQTLISGSEQEVDLEDLRRNTTYGNGYHDEHLTIDMFWEIAEELTGIQKRKLLRFVTSCSRPPLLGFKVRNLTLLEIENQHSLALLFRTCIRRSTFRTQEQKIGSQLQAHV